MEADWSRSAAREFPGSPGSSSELSQCWTAHRYSRPTRPPRSTNPGSLQGPAVTEKMVLKTEEEDGESQAWSGCVGRGLGISFDQHVTTCVV